MDIMWENTTPSTELPRDFCAEIGPLQLGAVLVHDYNHSKSPDCLSAWSPAPAYVSQGQICRRHGYVFS